MTTCAPRTRLSPRRRRGDDVTLWRKPALGGTVHVHAHYRRPRFRPHSHELFTICAVREGEARLEAPGTCRRVRPGSFSLIEPGVVHTGNCLSGELEYRTVYVTRAALEELLGLHPGGSRTVAFPRPSVTDPALAADFLAAHERLGKACGDRTAEADFADAVRGVLERHAVVKDRRAPASRLRRSVVDAVNYLHSHHNRNVRLAELAGRAGLSRFHFLNTFRRAMGLPPHAYLIQYRIERAQHLLLTGVPIASVAISLGFSDQSHLGKYFTSIVGVSPGRFVRALSTRCGEGLPSAQPRDTREPVEALIE